MYLKSNFNYLKDNKKLTYKRISEDTQINVNTLFILSHGNDENARIIVVKKLAVYFCVSLDDLINEDLKSRFEHLNI